MTENSTKIQSVIEKARRFVTPSEKEKQKLDNIVRKVSARIARVFQTIVKPEVKIGGSFAKGTWLPGGDIDFFLLYPIDYPRQRLETEAIEKAKTALDGYRINIRYAEHPYVEAKIEGTRVNLVPCYRVEMGKWQSAADRSPFHTEYVLKKFTDALRLETRLLKSFAKASGVYGAELKIQGLSGYVCEVLTLKFGSFVSVISHISTISPGEIVAIEPYDRDYAATFTSAVIVLDPVDSTRNLGAAISKKNLAKLALRSRSFLENPDLSFFKQAINPRKRSLEKRLLERTIVLTFKTRPRSVDVLWGQLYKSAEALGNKIESLDFKVLRRGAASNEKDESAFIFLLLEQKIPKYKVREGPSAFRKEDAMRYMEKNRGKAALSWLDQEGRLISLFPRATTDVYQELLRILGRDELVGSVGLSKEVVGEIRSFKLESGVGIMRSRRRDRAWLRKEVVSIVSEDEELRAT